MTTIALAGCAHIHIGGFIHTLKNRPDFVCKMVWDHDTARAGRRAGELGAAVAGSVEEICADSGIDAVLVCTETNLHEQVVLPLAAAHKHLFVEKPLGFASADAFRMAAAIEAAGVIYGTGFFMRGFPAHLFLKQQVNAGAFGRITRVRGSNCHSGALGHWFDTDWRWMADPKIAGVGAFGDLGAHMLDILLWLMGDVTEVTAQLDPGTGAYEGCDETGEGLLRFTSGAIGTVAAAWDDVSDPVTLQICGTEGHAVIISGDLYFQSSHVEGADGKTPWTDLPPAQPASLDAFLDAVAGHPAALVTVREAATRSAVMEALYAGAQSGTWTTPKTSE